MPLNTLMNIRLSILLNVLLLNFQRAFLRPSEAKVFLFP